MGHLYYNYRDILKAPRLALMGKNLYIMMSHMVLGYAVYLVLTYIALLISGLTLTQIWQVHFIFPFSGLELSGFISQVVWYLSIILWLALFLRGSLGVARCTFEELRGNFFFSAGEAFAFIKKHNWLVYRAIFGALLFIGVLFLLILIVGGIGKIPIIGEIIFGLFYDFPIFVISLFAVLMIFLMTTLLLTAPAVVAVKGEDAMTALFDGFSTIIAQPLKWFLYVGGSYLIARATTFVFTYFALRALQFTNFTAGIIMGQKQIDLFSVYVPELLHKFPLMKYLVSPCSGFSINLQNFFETGYISNPSWSFSLGGLFLMISVLLILILLVCYFLNILICAQVIAFLDIRYATHGEKLAFMPEDALQSDQKTN